jgi:5'-nucleotidase
MHHTLTKRIAVDMDEVMADTLTRWLECYNRDFSTTITKADLYGKRLYDVVGPSRATAARAFLDRPEFFRDLPLMALSKGRTRFDRPPKHQTMPPLARST